MSIPHRLVLILHFTHGDVSGFRGSLLLEVSTNKSR